MLFPRSIVSGLKKRMDVRALKRRHLNFVFFFGSITYILWMCGNLWFGTQHLRMSKGNRPGTQLPLATQQEIDHIAKALHVTLMPVKYYDPYRLVANMTLSNQGRQPIPASAWELYGYFYKTFDDFTVSEYKHGVFLDSCGLTFYHVAGYLFKFEPAPGKYRELKSNGSCGFLLDQVCLEIRHDVFPNWYVSSRSRDVIPKLIANTQGEGMGFSQDLDPKTADSKETRTYLESMADPAVRFRSYQRTKDVELGRVPVLPTPLVVEERSDNHTVFDAKTWVIARSNDFLAEQRRLSAFLKIKIVDIQAETSPHIILRQQSINGKGMTVGNPEAYELEITSNAVFIRANSEEGAFYAIQTLLSLMRVSGDLSRSRLPMVVVRDAPRFSYRGLLLDVARNFFKKEKIMKLMDVMAMYKMNKLHLHLSDDEGWRLQIPGLPQLTEIGSRRCHDPEENRCLMPNLGSGPYLNSSGNGFYSVEDYRDILKHAVSLHITVIPEFDMPGHSAAAIKSVHAASQSSKDPVYALKDVQDRTQYVSIQMHTDNVMNPCLDSTYVFTMKVISEVKKMHADIQALQMYHLGGDEVPGDAWAASPACTAFKNQHPEIKTDQDLMNYFVGKVAEQCAHQQLSVGMWESSGIMVKSDEETNVSIPAPRAHFSNDDVFVYLWGNTLDIRHPHRSRLFANNGYKVVLAPCNFFYLDHRYDYDREEPGTGWAAEYLATWNVWGFSLDKIWEDVEETCPNAVEDLTDCWDLKLADNILGIQAQIWVESIRNEEQLESMLFPRLLAVAERAWHKASWENVSEPETKSMMIDASWIEFSNVVGKLELKKLDSLGIKYRIPTPGARASEGGLELNTEFPGLITEYYSKQHRQWIPAEEVHVADNEEGEVLVRTRSPSGKRHSRIISV